MSNYYDNMGFGATEFQGIPTPMGMVFIRELSGAEAKLVHNLKVEDDRVAFEIALSLVDDKGNRCFDENNAEHIAKINNFHVTKINMLMQACDKVNGYRSLDDDEFEEQVGN